jgi:hypothetical protein
VNKIIPLTFVNLVTRKAGAKNELLFKKLPSELYCFVYAYLCCIVIQGDLRFEKNRPIFFKSSQNSCQAEICQNIYIKPQSDTTTSKHFWNLKMKHVLLLIIEVKILKKWLPKSSPKCCHFWASGLLHLKKCNQVCSSFHGHNFKCFKKLECLSVASLSSLV